MSMDQITVSGRINANMESAALRWLVFNMVQQALARNGSLHAAYGIRNGLCYLPVRSMASTNSDACSGSVW